MVLHGGYRHGDGPNRVYDYPLCFDGNYYRYIHTMERKYHTIDGKSYPEYMIRDALHLYNVVMQLMKSDATEG